MSNNILPLIEIVIDIPRTNYLGDFTTFHQDFFKKLNRPLIVDIPLYLKLSKRTRENVLNFLAPIYYKPLLRIDYFNKLLELEEIKIVPTLTYNPNDKYKKGFIVSQKNLLIKAKYIAYRIFENVTDEILTEIEEIITKNDLLILDIRESDYKLYEHLYDKILDIKNKKQCKVALIKAALSTHIKNTELIDGKYIDDTLANNSLIYNYENYGFDHFGDYSGIIRRELDHIPVSSPAYISLDYKKNRYVGFKGEFKKIKTFETMVLPKYTSSEFWRLTSLSHIENCYGCSLINEMLKNNIKPNYASRWKTISISHYLRTIDELISKLNIKKS